MTAMTSNLLTDLASRPDDVLSDKTKLCLRRALGYWQVHRVHSGTSSAQRELSADEYAGMRAGIAAHAGIFFTIMSWCRQAATRLCHS